LASLVFQQEIGQGFASTGLPQGHVASLRRRRRLVLGLRRESWGSGTFSGRSAAKTPFGWGFAFVRRQFQPSPSWRGRSPLSDVIVRWRVIAWRRPVNCELAVWRCGMLLVKQLDVLSGGVRSTGHRDLDPSCPPSHERRRRGHEVLGLLLSFNTLSDAGTPTCAIHVFAKPREWRAAVEAKFFALAVALVDEASVLTPLFKNDRLGGFARWGSRIS